MAITIYTYSNPYEINKEPYFASIQNCFHLCVSQTLVNGLCDQYKDFYKGKLTTVTRFINELYSDWESVSIAISQRAAIDNLIEYMDLSMIVDDISSKDVITSLKRNRINTGLIFSEDDLQLNDPVRKRKFISEYLLYC